MQTTTKLEAVNTILAVLGESPLVSLSDNKTVEGQMAEQLLDTVSREVQSLGWNFNTEYKVEFTPDADKYVYLNGNTMRMDVEPGEYTSGDIVQRGVRMYDRKNHTYEITASPIKATVVYGLEWDEIPEPARYYIVIRAGRIYQDRMVGAGDHHTFTMKEENAALTALRNWEAESQDASVFDNYDVFRVIDRTGHPIIGPLNTGD